MLNKLSNKLVICGLAAMATACNDSNGSSTSTPTISHGKSLTSSGAPSVDRSKMLSELTATERVEFVRAVETRVSGLLNNNRLYENMCNMSGAMAGLTQLASGESGASATNLCEEVTSGCREGMSNVPEGPIALEANPATFACDAPVNNVLGCLEESVRVMEGIRDVAGSMTCTSPKSSVERLVRTLQRLAPNRTDCENVQNACPNLQMGMSNSDESMSYEVDIERPENPIETPDFDADNGFDNGFDGADNGNDFDGPDFDNGDNDDEWGTDEGDEGDDDFGSDDFEDDDF